MILFLQYSVPAIFQSAPKRFSGEWQKKTEKDLIVVLYGIYYTVPLWRRKREAPFFPLLCHDNSR